MHIESLQDSEKYDSKQTQAGVSASVAIYGSGSSVSAQMSQAKAKVDYAQVNQQSGFHIGKSSEINVAENTHLKGGIINAQGEKEHHRMRTGTLTTENIENRSDIKVSSISAGASTDMSKMASSAMSAALSALGNVSESERSTTHSAISDNINLQITDSKAQQAKTGKTAEETLQSLNRNTENANKVLEKQNLTKIQERQEATQILAEMGAKRVGDLAQQMGWEDGSPEKVALHGLVGYLSAKVGGGNTAASTLSAMGSEYINTEIANYLANNTDLTSDQRKAIQQASAAGLGALIGASLGGNSITTKQSAQMALRTEQFNRQLHPDELQRIEELANGDEEKQHRLEIAACALVHCSAQIPTDDPEYVKIKAIEELGNTSEFAGERTLLSQQKARVDMTDAWFAERRKLFEYTTANRLGDKDDAGPRLVVRTTGLVQATGGVATTVFGTGLCQSGLGCVAGVPVATYGMDNFVSGARTAYSGKYVSTVGAKAIFQLTGLSESTSEFIYGMPSVIIGAKPIIVSTTKATGKVANKVGRIGGEVKYVVSELGRDVKSISSYVNDKTLALPNNKYILQATDSIEKGIDSIENISPKKYLYTASIGYVASSTSQYIFNRDIDHAKSLKTGLITPYLTLTSPVTGLTIGSVDTAISTKVTGKENYLKDQTEYLKSSITSEMINNTPYINKHPLGDIIKILNSELINEQINQREGK